MRISDWSSDLCSSDLSASGEPAPELGPARFLLHGLEESDEMNDERDQRPARNLDDPPIGPADQQQREQDHHVGIAACRDQPEPAVESTPYMDVHPETYDERALDQPLRDVAEQHGADHRPE